MTQETNAPAGANGEARPRRGRPPKKIVAQKIEAEARAQGAIDAAEAMPARRAEAEARTDEQPRRRRRRKGALDGTYNKRINTFIEKDPNYYYFWASDNKPGRIQMLTEHDDYDVVTEQPKQFAGRDSQGQPGHMFLLRKPIDLWEEDEAEKREFRNRGLDSIKAGKGTGDPREQAPDTADGQPGLYGRVNLSEGGGSR